MLISWYIRYPFLTPFQWVGPTRYRGPHLLLGRGGNAGNVGPTDTDIEGFMKNVKCFFY